MWRTGQSFLQQEVGNDGERRPRRGFARLALWPTRTQSHTTGQVDLLQGDHARSGLSTRPSSSSCRPMLSHTCPTRSHAKNTSSHFTLQCAATAAQCSAHTCVKSKTHDSTMAFACNHAEGVCGLTHPEDRAVTPLLPASPSSCKFSQWHTGVSHTSDATGAVKNSKKETRTLDCNWCCSCCRDSASRWLHLVCVCSGCLGDIPQQW
jgi:hypothetical protein